MQRRNPLFAGTGPLTPTPSASVEQAFSKYLECGIFAHALRVFFRVIQQCLAAPEMRRVSNRSHDEKI